LEGVEQRRHLRSRCLCFPFLNLELWESLNIRGERKGYGSCCVGHIYIYMYIYICVLSIYIYTHYPNQNQFSPIDKSPNPSNLHCIRLIIWIWLTNMHSKIKRNGTYKTDWAL
jgi:hypothetical protein